MPLKRDEISKEEKWKVEDIYASDSEWEKAFAEVETSAAQPCIYAGHMAESADNLYHVLVESDSTDMRLERLYVYAFMKYYEDTSNPKYQEMSGKAQGLSVKVSSKYSFITPELMSIPADILEQYRRADNGIALYNHYIDDMLEERAHILSDAEENLLANSRQMSTSPNEIFSKFNNADVKFDSVTDSDGNGHELTNGSYGKYMESQDRVLRKNTFKSLYKSYGDVANTLASTFYANVKQDKFYASTRKYSSTLEMHLSGSFIPVSVYENLIKAVNDNIGLMHRYVDIRKRALGVSELHFYDVYAPMVSDFSMSVDYERAKQIVLDGLEPLGEDYRAIIKEGYNNGWIDVRENAGKRTGAFSWGTYGVHPYVFLNYSDTLNNVFTLAHEMGHAIHTYKSNNTQPYVYAGYRIFVAEVASTCNEALLINYLIKNSTDIKEKKYLINHYLEQFKGTLFRQTMFAEFEMITHRLAEDGEILSKEVLCNEYKKLNKKYFGENMVIDDEIALEWSRIPHFYTPFYVYQYATGFSAAIAISAKILSGEEGAVDGYFKFLSGGSSLHPIELLKLCGVDMESPEPVADALRVFEELLDEFESLQE